jgi:hypothetical protein
MERVPAGLEGLAVEEVSGDVSLGGLVSSTSAQ